MISVVIPVKNGASTLARCLEGLMKQTIYDQTEIIIIDSGSKDGTLEIIEKFPVKLIRIEPEKFNHGLTRNLGIQHSIGKLIYFTVQDAYLEEANVLERFVNHFTNERIDGVCGNQGIPHDQDKNPYCWYRPMEAPSVKTYNFNSAFEFDSLTPQQKAEVCSWDDVHAMYRKSALLKIPFIKTDYAEDMYWANDALRNGFTLVKDTSLITWHYHHRSYQYELKLMVTNMYHKYKLFSYETHFPGMLRSIASISKRLLTVSGLTLKRRIYWLIHNLRILQADKKAISEFRMALNSGENGLEKFYYKYFSSSLQGKLKSD